MKISGFTMVRNATKFYYPIKESISSVLPLVDEFIVALGKGDEDDKTRQLIESIESDKIKIIERIWDENDFKESIIFAKETNFALSQCSGDWCFYIQADEVVHEQDIKVIKQACKKHLSNHEVDGLLFDYFHFFGDYAHYLNSSGWYKHEIRIVRNNKGIYSYKDAQSFRKGKDEKLNVAKTYANMYHYGWVRPPVLMQSKKKEHDSTYHGIEVSEKKYKTIATDFNYGNMSKVPVFKGTHPKIMNEFISKISWKESLSFKKIKLNRDKMKHERFKYKFKALLSDCLGISLGEFTNWNKVFD